MNVGLLLLLLQKSRPSSNLGVIGSTPGSPQSTPQNVAICRVTSLRNKSDVGGIRQWISNAVVSSASGKISACCLVILNQLPYTVRQARNPSSISDSPFLTPVTASFFSQFTTHHLGYKPFHSELKTHFSQILRTILFLKTVFVDYSSGRIFWGYELIGFVSSYLFMAALCNRCGHYIFALWFLYLFFPRLISAAAGWMSTILWHMVWP